MSRRTPLERFQQKYVLAPTGCWLWTGAMSDNGYGFIKVDGKQTRAHRVSYELHVGPIPEGLVIDHLCRVRHCVNPRHLEPVTQHENILRGERATKTHCINGHPFDSINTYVRPDGRRECRACRAAQSREYPRRTARRMARVAA